MLSGTMSKFCDLLDKMLEDEKKATTEYEELIGLADEKTKIIIESIKRDEIKHHHLLKELRPLVCG